MSSADVKFLVSFFNDSFWNVQFQIYVLDFFFFEGSKRSRLQSKQALTSVDHSFQNLFKCLKEKE